MPDDCEVGKRAVPWLTAGFPLGAKRQPTMIAFNQLLDLLARNRDGVSPTEIRMETGWAPHKVRKWVREFEALGFVRADRRKKPWVIKLGPRLAELILLYQGKKS